MWSSPVMHFMHGMNAAATTFHSAINLHLKHLTVLWTAAMFAMFCNNWKRKIKYTAQSHSGKTGGFSCCERGRPKGNPQRKKHHMDPPLCNLLSKQVKNWNGKDSGANFLIERDARQNCEIERPRKIWTLEKERMVTVLTKDPFELVEDIGDLTFEHVKGHLYIR